MHLQRLFLCMILTLAPCALSAYENKDIVIAFDLHGVLFELDMEQLMPTVGKELWKTPTLPFRLAYQAVSKKGSIFKESGVRNMANCQRPVEETWNLIRELKKAGHPVYIFSNINELTLKELMVKFPDRFHLFDGILSVPDGKRELRKPRTRAYTRFKDLIQERHQLQKIRIVFIDDKDANIAKGRKQGFIGIKYTNAPDLKKNVATHIKQLQEQTNK